MARNWLRCCTLALVGANGGPGDTVLRYRGGNDLAMDFEIECHTLQSPDVACFVLKNVSPATAAKVQKEFTEVVFSVGYLEYDGNSNPRESEIFRGQIVETQYGEKVDNFTTDLLRIWCANSDLAYRAPVSKSLAPGYTHQDVIDTCFKAMQAAQPNLTMGVVAGVNLSSFQFPRGTMLAGQARDFIREACLSLGANWTLTGNKLSIVGKDSPGIGSSGIVLSPGTGEVSQPILRPEGVIVSCLINPAIQINTTVKIDSTVVTSQVSPSPVVPNSTLKQQQYANQTNANGEYRVLHYVVNGSTRGGNEWTMRLTTLGVGQGVNTTQAGLGYS